MRFRTLDAVRGIAAFAVLLFHVVGTFPSGGEQRQELLAKGFHAPQAWLYLTPLRLAVSGPVAVLLFFVLSGYVLMLSLHPSRQPGYRGFVIARFARIWVPFAVAILCASGLSFFLAARPVPDVAQPFFNNWNHSVTPGHVLRHLLMTGNAVDLDGPMWSLIHELRISFIFPLLVLATMRYGLLALTASILLALGCILLLSRGDYGHMTTILQTATYVYLFVIGILVALHQERICTFLRSLSRRTLALLWLTALSGVAIAPSATNYVDDLGNGLLILINGFSSGLIIALCSIGGRAEKLLMTPVPLFLGRISYSLYLTHAIVILTIVHAVGRTWPLALSMVISIPAALAVAHFSQRHVEAPSQRFGKFLAERMRSHKNALNKPWAMSSNARVQTPPSHGVGDAS